VNELELSNPHNAFEIAANALPPEQKKTGFEMAAELALPDKNLTVEKKKMLDTLKDRLSINNDFAKQAIRNQTEIKQNSS